MELIDIKLHREYEQQEFVRKLAREIRDKADESCKYELHIFNTFLFLVEDLLARMLTRRGVPYFDLSPLKNLP